MTRTLHNEAVVANVHGLRAVLVIPVIPDDASDYIREGLARRRMVALGQQCPCAAQPPRLTRQQRRALERAREKGQGAQLRAAIEHEADCPAVDGNLVPALREWASESDD